MPEIEFTGKRKTKPTGFSLAPNVVEKLEEFAESGKYGSKSAIASQALSEFFTREEMRDEKGQQTESVHEEIKSYLKSPEGKALIKSIIRESLASPSKNSQPIVVEDIIE